MAGKYGKGMIKPSVPGSRGGGQWTNTNGTIGKSQPKTDPSNATASTKESLGVENKLNYGPNASGISTRKAS